MPEIYRKTPKGQQVLQDKSVHLRARLRMAFILFDGKTSLEQIYKNTVGLGFGPADLEELIRLDLLTQVLPTPIAVPNPADRLNPPSSHFMDGEESVSTIMTAAAIDPSEYLARYQRAYPLAVKLTSDMGLRGFKLNLAVEAAMGYEDLVALLPELIKAFGRDATRALRHALLRHPP